MDEIHAYARSSDEVDESKVHVYSDSVSCLGRYKSIQKQTQDGMLNSKNFSSPILTENYLESMENRLSSSGIFPWTYVIGNLPEDPKESARSNQ